jgi:4-diphosphocytidyl-2-C-methyl-D-erythritol kinase
MSRATRRARVKALAKLNLDLRVLYRRPDQYHELRTIFQTISLGDSIDIAFTPARTTRVSIEGNREIPDNIVGRAAELVLDQTRASGHVEFRLRKRIPMGGGLGGGSSDAAAVLLALPVLAGRTLAIERLMELATQLGSDVPFFLLGGAAAGIGRGAELFPLPDVGRTFGIVVSSGLHVSTAAAYSALHPRLTTESIQNKMVSFQSLLWSRGSVSPQGANDFEAVVFAQYPELAALKRRLQKSGAKPAMMTGSGSALFGLFRTREEVARASRSITGDVEVFPISFVSRSQYRALWWRRLGRHLKEKQWPPPSRYVR